MKNIRTSFKQYKKECTDTVDIKTYLLLSALYIKFLMEKVFDGYEVTLPSKMGTIKIVGLKEKVKFDEDGKVIGLSPNWKKTMELWNENPEAKENKTLVYNTNEHSSGIRYKFLWSKKRVLITNKTIYSLIMTRNNKRTVRKKIIEEGKEYITCN